MLARWPLLRIGRGLTRERTTSTHRGCPDPGTQSTRVRLDLAHILDLVILAAVQDVNVLRDDWDWIFGGAGVIGALGAIVALLYAAKAQRDATWARLEVVAERRRQFQLEVLREIAAGIDDGFLYKIGEDPLRLRKFARRLELLPRSDLPTWRTVMDMRWQDEVSEHMGFKEPWMAKSREVFESAQAGARVPEAERAAWQARDDRLAEELQEIAFTFNEALSTRLNQELITAITARVEAGRFRPSRRFPLRRRLPVGPIDRIEEDASTRFARADRTST